MSQAFTEFRWRVDGQREDGLKCPQAERQVVLSVRASRSKALSVAGIKGWHGPGSQREGGRVGPQEHSLLAEMQADTTLETRFATLLVGKLALEQERVLIPCWHCGRGGLSDCRKEAVLEAKLRTPRVSGLLRVQRRQSL